MKAIPPQQELYKKDYFAEVFFTDAVGAALINISKVGFGSPSHYGTFFYFCRNHVGAAAGCYRLVDL
jgi:hypothetical protein